MKTTILPDYRPSWWPYVAMAIVAHVIAVFFMLLDKPSVYLADANVSSMIGFRLVPPKEGERAVFVMSKAPGGSPPRGADGLADPGMDPGSRVPDLQDDDSAGVNDAELAKILASERDALRVELEQMTDVADASEVAGKEVPLPPPEGHGGTAGPGPEGAVRELDLGGFPQKVVDDIMARYNLKVVTQTIRGGRRGQSFLSSATRGASEQYFGGMTVPEGVYEVFQLSRESVALMSRLEEDALRAEGFEPLQSRVVRIVFGIVKDDKEDYVLGVKSLKAEAVGR